MLRQNQHIKILLAIFMMLFIGCHDKKQNTILEQFFEDNILDKAFIITHASNASEDLTTSYDGYNFVLKKGRDYYSGALKVTHSSIGYSGTWTSNEDYSRLKIVLPALPVEFKFLTRDWRFTSKNLPELKFAPWGGGDDVQLTMKRK